MKKIRYYILLMTGLLLSASCTDFLTELPQSSLSQEQVFSDEKNVESYVKGLYTKWRNLHKGPYSFYVYYLGTDEAAQGGCQWRDNIVGRQLDTYNNLTSTNDVVLSTWETRYDIIAGASSMLKVTQSTVEDANEKMQILIGEASLLRAVNYFELVQLFGPIPKIDYLHDNGVNDRRPVSEIYQLIEEDLLRAVQYLPNFDEQTDYSRATRRLANALLGKLYLHAEPDATRPNGDKWRDYVKAAEAFEAVIQESGIGAQLPYQSEPEKIFGNTQDVTKPTIPVDGDPQVEKEWIYAFRFGHENGDENSMEWHMGSRAVSIMSTTGEALCYWAGFDHALPNEYCWKLKEDGGVWDKKDKRRMLSFRGINADDSDIVESQFDDPRNGWKAQIIGYCFGDELQPHCMKYEDPGIDELGVNTFRSGRTIPYIRMSDIFLCLGECLYLSGDHTKGLSYINAVRTRAGFTRSNRWKEGDFADNDAFISALLDERMRELNFEGWRRFDLLRTGYLFRPEIMKRHKWFVHDNVGVVDPKYQYWPIPLDEINKNANLTVEDQNKGY